MLCYGYSTSISFSPVFFPLKIPGSLSFCNSYLKFLFMSDIMWITGRKGRQLPTVCILFVFNYNFFSFIHAAQQRRDPHCAEKRSSFLLACIIITIIIITDCSWYQKQKKRAVGTLETSREDIKFITKSKRKEPWAPWGRAGRISNLFLDRGVHCTVKFCQSICGYWALG